MMRTPPSSVIGRFSHGSPVRSGQTLVEAIVAMGVIIAFAAALARLTLGAYEGRRASRDHTNASFFAWEGLETVRSIAEEDFSLLQDGTYGIGSGTGGVMLTVLPDVREKFTRQIGILSVMRDADGGIASDGNDLDRGSKTVTSMVTWLLPDGRSQVVRFATELTDWRQPRWLIDLLSEFTPGSLHATTLTEQEDGEASLSRGSLRSLAVLLEETLPGNAPVLDMELDPIADRLYIATGNNAEGAEFLAYDLSNVDRNELPLVGSTDLGDSARAIAIGEEHAFVVTEDPDREVQVVRLTDFSVATTWDLDDAAVPIDIALDEGTDRAYVITSNEAVHIPEIVRFSFLPKFWKQFLVSALRLFSPFQREQAFAQSAPTCLGQTATIYVNSSNKIVGGPDNGNTYSGTLNGTTGADVMVGTSSADTIDGKAGADTICGGDGNDTLKGGNGNDTLSGENGVDSVQGEAGVDTLYGGEGNDTIEAGNGDDIAYGGNGDDTLRGEGNADVLYGEAGNDTFEGGSGDDTMYGSTGNDIFDGAGNADIACGESGTDTMDGGSGNDQLDGGSGTDTLDGESNTDICQNGETLTSCEDTTTAIPTCPIEVEEEEEEEVVEEERDTHIPVEKFYVLNISDPESSAVSILHQSYVRAPRRILLRDNVAYILSNSERLSYLRMLSLHDYEHTADCVLQGGKHGNDFALHGSRVFVAFDQSFEAEFVEYALDPENPSDCNALNAHARSRTEFPDTVRSVTVLPERDLAFVTVGQGQAALQTINLANDDAPPELLREFRGVCDDLVTIGSYLFAGCRATDATVTVLRGEEETEERFFWGTYTSPPFDAEASDVEWKNIAWEESEGAALELRTRTADSLENLARASWVGPDGTRSSSYRESGGESVEVHAKRTGTQWMQWKAYFTGTGTTFPELQRVLLTFE